MKLRNRIFLVGTIAAISTPAIAMATFACAQVNKYNISVSDKRVILSQYNIEKGKDLGFVYLKTVDPEKCTDIEVKDVLINGKSMKDQYKVRQVKKDDWKYVLSLNDGVEVNGSIDIIVNVTASYLTVNVNDEGVVFETKATQYYKDVTVLLGMDKSITETGIDGVESVKVAGQPIDPQYYELKPVVSPDFKYSLTIKEDTEHPHIISGNIDINLKLKEMFCNVTCNPSSVDISKTKVIKNNSFSVQLKPQSDAEQITSLTEVKIGNKTVPAEKIEFMSYVSPLEGGWTHILKIDDASLITDDISIKLQVTSSTFHKININNKNVIASAWKAEQGKDLEVYLGGNTGYLIADLDKISVGDRQLVDGEFKFIPVQDVEKYPQATRLLTVKKELITDDINLEISTNKILSFLSIDGTKPSKINASLEPQSLPVGPISDKQSPIILTIDHAEDCSIKTEYLDVKIGNETITDGAIVTRTQFDPPGAYKIYFNSKKISEITDEDITFCIKDMMETDLVDYNCSYYNEYWEELDLPALKITTPESWNEGFWHNERVEADLEISDPTSSKFVFKDLRIKLGDYDHYLVKNKDYILTIDEDDQTKTHLIINEGVIDEPDVSTDPLKYLRFEWQLFDTVQRHSCFISDGISTTNIQFTNEQDFVQCIDDEIVDKSKHLEDIVVKGRNHDGGWTPLDIGLDYTFDKKTHTITIFKSALLKDISIELILVGADQYEFIRDSWANLGYWSSTDDIALLTRVYRLNSKDDFIGKTRFVHYDDWYQCVRIVDICHDYLKYANEGDLDGEKGKHAVFTFQFDNLITGYSPRKVTINIGKEDTNNQNYWRYNSGLEGKGQWGHQSNARTFLQGEFDEKFDKEVKPWVKTVTKRKVANVEMEDGQPKNKFMLFNDKFFLPTVTELNGSHGKEGTVGESGYIREGQLYAFYDDGSNGHDGEWEPRGKTYESDKEYHEYWTSSYSTIYTYYGLSYDYDTGVYIDDGSQSGGIDWEEVGHMKGLAPMFCF